MKKLFLSLLALSLSGLTAQAQFQTPGTGRRYTLAQLVAATGSNVTNPSPGVFEVGGDLRLSPTDTLRINSNATLRLASLAQMKFDGVVLVGPRDSVKITAQSPTAPFHSLAFSATSEGSRLRKTIVEYGGGIKVVSASLIMDSCIVRYQVARIGGVNTNSGALNASGSAPVVTNSLFHSNARSAILTPANIGTSPVIRNCVFRNNDTENGNYPQINIGIGASTPILIEKCRVTGGPYIMAGGISISNLLGTGSATQAVIRQNYIANNRYGLALLGSNINARVSRNVIEDNNINPNAQTGGSGLNLQGSNTLTGFFARNVVRGNLWGVTILRTNMTTTVPGPTMVFGDVASTDTLGVGLNHFFNNGNGGQIQDFYNNTPDNQLAQNNDWHVYSAAAIEAHITHQVDIASLGLVNFQPFRTPMGMGAAAAAPLAASLYPNPATEMLRLSVPSPAPVVLELRELTGRRVLVATVQPVAGLALLPLGSMPAGLYLLQATQQGQVLTQKVTVAR